MKKESFFGPTILKTFLIVLLVTGGFISNAQLSWNKATGIDSLATNNFFTDGKYCYAGTLDSGVYRSSDGGISWISANTGIIDSFQIRRANNFSSSGNMLYVAFGHALGGHIYYSPDQATTWFPTTYPTGATDLVVLDSVICASTGSGFFLFSRSTDSGLSWNTTQHPFQEYYFHYRKWGDSLFCLSNSLGIMLSADHGSSWNTFGFQGIMCLDYFIKEGIIGVSNTEGIFLSDDMGLNWNNACTAGLDADSSQIVHFSIAGDTIFATSDTAIYFSVFSGVSMTSWTAIPKNGLPFLDPLHYISAFEASHGVLKIGTTDVLAAGTSSPAKGMGVWFNNLLIPSLIEKPDLKHYLSVSPNPANDRIRITTELREFRLSITNAMGQAILCENNVTLIDISQFPPGLYFISLTDSFGFWVNGKFIKY